MLSIFFNGRFTALHYRRLAWRLFFLSLLASIGIYILLRLLLFGDDVSLADEALIWLKMGAVGAAFSGGGVLLVFLLNRTDALLHRRRVVRRWRSIYAGALALLLAGQVEAQSTGTMRQKGSGLQTKYTGLKPVSAKLMANDEVMNHNQVLLGEDFVILNENVTGFVQKGGKVAIGCSLTIADNKGKELMKMSDLFAAKEIFSVADAKFLRCTVSTGKPMDWDQHYTVTVVFWDKWGKGRITNRVVIETIDLP